MVHGGLLRVPFAFFCTHIALDNPLLLVNVIKGSVLEVQNIIEPHTTTTYHQRRLLQPDVRTGLGGGQEGKKGVG
jgi:hypothetical protein